jgi:hypothetical protein
MTTTHQPLAKLYLGEWAPVYYRNREWNVAKMDGTEMILQWSDHGDVGTGNVRCGEHSVTLAWNPLTNNLRTISDCVEE